MTITKEAVGSKMKEIRGKRRQQDVADKAGIPLRTYQSYERAENETPVTAAAQIAQALDVSLDYLVGLSNAEKPAPNKEQAEMRHKGVMSQGSITPAGGPTVDSYELLIGYFDFHDRRVSASMLFRASGDPPRFGGWTPPDNGNE